MDRRAVLIVPLLMLVSLTAGYLYASHLFSGGAPASPTPVGTASTTVINGTVFLVSEVSDLGRGVALGGVVFRQMDVTFTGCPGRAFIVAFPDGAVEKLVISYGCPSFVSTTTSTRRILEAWSKHSSPRAGIVEEQGRLRILVSVSQPGWRMLAYNSSGDWLVLAVAPRSFGSRILYEAIYTGPGFFPNASAPSVGGGEVAIIASNGNTTVLPEKGLCPRIGGDGTTVLWNETYVPAGYVYRYWVDLAGLASAPGTYRVRMTVHCMIPVAGRGSQSPGYESISAELSFEVGLK